MKKWDFFLPALMSIAMVGCSITPEQPVEKSETSKAETTQTEKVITTKPVEKPKPDFSPVEKRPSVKPKPIPKDKPQQPKAPVTVSVGEKSADGKLILGQKEWVHVEGLGINVVARVDTGATTSSVSAIDIVAFERDGKKWVKFKLAHDGKESKELELPVISTKSIRQSSSDETFERYVVEGWIKVGDLKVKTPFTLADRTHMDFGLLLGRSFFRDVAIVDVSREFVQPKVSLDASK
ncbi:ATP-dependent zinc protease [Vibrio sp.]|uniref:ATP-dependent zinc protease family protein n=1 Tax=Vibrio sp. TaxID=678 RepID=UPI003AA92B59